MNDNADVFTGPAVTALGLAASRTVESSQPDNLINDPLARVFFDAAQVTLPMRLEWPAPGEMISDAERLHLHGSRYIGLRTRFYDDVLVDAAAKGVRQGVLVGAGLDTRAFRLPIPSGFSIFELDQTPLLEWKQTVLDANAATPNCRRLWIGTDLREDFTSQLAGHGFDATQPTVFVAEGLLPYLTTEEQLDLLDRIDALAATGSVLALDKIIGDPHAAGRVASLSCRSGLDMTRLLAHGQNTDIAAMLRCHGWTIEELRVSEIAASLDRDLSDPFGNSEAQEPPWFETCFLQGSR